MNVQSFVAEQRASITSFLRNGAALDRAPPRRRKSKLVFSLVGKNKL